MYNNDYTVEEFTEEGEPTNLYEASLVIEKIQSELQEVYYAGMCIEEVELRILEKQLLEAQKVFNYFKALEIRKS